MADGRRAGASPLDLASTGSQQAELCAASAYFALWGLYELSPDEEPDFVKRTRLYLEDALDGRSDRLPRQPAEEGPPRLRAVPEPSGS